MNYFVYYPHINFTNYTLKYKSFINKYKTGIPTVVLFGRTV